MNKLLSILNNPIVGAVMTLIGVLELLFKIPSIYFTYQISLWIIILCVGLIILLSWIYKRAKIKYYIKNYTSDAFGGSYTYKWQWIRATNGYNVYGYFPDRIEVVEPAKLNPDIKVIDCAHHYINNKDLLQEYIMLSLYNKVENTQQTNLFVLQMHELEAHYSKQRQR